LHIDLSINISSQYVEASSILSIILNMSAKHKEMYLYNILKKVKSIMLLSLKK